MLISVHRHPFLRVILVRLAYASLAFAAAIAFSSTLLAQQNGHLPSASVDLPSSIEGIEIAGSQPFFDSTLPPPIELWPSTESQHPFASVNRPVRIAPELRPIVRPIRTMSDIVLRSQEISTKNVLGRRLVHVRAQDDVWLVSARNETSSSLSCQRLVDGQWCGSSLDNLATAKALSPDMPTLVYVHGDRTDEQYARSRGLQFYENVFNPDKCGDSGPIRFVIFAWKAEREIMRPSFDYRLKLLRSVQLGQTFRSFLSRFHDRQMLLVGFSLGGQVILSGISNPDTSDSICNYCNLQTGQYRLALITPSLAPNETQTSIDPLPYLTSVQETHVFINKKDNAIRAANVVNRNNCIDAQKELSSLARGCLACAPNQVRIHDMTPEVGHCHSITKYSEASVLLRSELMRLCNEMRPYGNIEIYSPPQDPN